jgi:hypothetical protein
MGAADRFKRIAFPSNITVLRTTIHDVAQEELLALFTESLQKEVLKSVFQQRLPLLDEKLEKMLALKGQWFEPVTNGKGICSIHGIKNKELNKLRILYCIKENHVYLLHAFCEKNRGDYHRHTKIAQERMKNI